MSESKLPLFIALMLIGATIVYFVPTILLQNQNQMHQVEIIGETEQVADIYIEGTDTFTLIMASLASPVGMALCLIAFAVIFVGLVGYFKTRA
jgi:hypothetical protein